jgi:hypothetical protein
MRFFAILTIVLLLIPSNICGALVQGEGCMPKGKCCCVSQADETPAASAYSFTTKCNCKADRGPAPSENNPRPARSFADTSIDNFGPLVCVAIVAVEFNDSTISQYAWRYFAPRAPPTAVYFSTQSILC